MLKAILFDLDNTLIDFMGIKKASCRESVRAMREAGLKLDEEKAYNLLFDLYSKYGIEYSKIFQKFVLAAAGTMDMKIISAGIVAYRKSQDRNRKPYKNVIPVLLKLRKNYKLGIVSDAPSLKAWIRLQELGVADYFDIVIAHEGGKEYKPARFPFAKAIKQLGVRAEEILFIGDQPHRDIKGAKTLGMKTALAEYGIQDIHRKYMNKNKPDFYLKNIGDVLRILS